MKSADKIQIELEKEMTERLKELHPEVEDKDYYYDWANAELKESSESSYINLTVYDSKNLNPLSKIQLKFFQSQKDNQMVDIIFEGTNL